MKAIYKTKTFVRWARKNNVADSCFVNAVLEMESGLIDANLGGGVYKKRIPLTGKGKRGGTRSIIATHFKGTFFFLRGFAKNETSTISDQELDVYKIVARTYLSIGKRKLEEMLLDGTIAEVKI